MYISLYTYIYLYTKYIYFPLFPHQQAAQLAPRHVLIIFHRLVASCSCYHWQLPNAMISFVICISCTYFSYFSYFAFFGCSHNIRSAGRLLYLLLLAYFVHILHILYIFCIFCLYFAFFACSHNIPPAGRLLHLLLLAVDQREELLCSKKSWETLLSDPLNDNYS